MTHAPRDLSCNNPTSFSGVAGSSLDTGYIACDEGWYHRPERGECPTALPRAEGIPGVIGPGLTAEQVGVCYDSDCTAQAHGFCAQIDWAGPARCIDGCVRDDECPQGQICFCGDPVGVCVPARCQTDADCPDSLCIGTRNPALSSGGVDVVFFACTTPQDACLAPTHCPNGWCSDLGSRRACEGPPVQ